MPITPVGSRMSAGVWWDISQKSTMAAIPKWIDAMKRARIDEVWTMLNGSERDGGAIKWRWDAAALGEFAAALRIEGIEFGVTLWAWPDHTIPTVIQRVDEYCYHSDPLAIELDLEGNWGRGNVRGYGSLSAAGDALWRGLKKREVAVTSFPLHSVWGDTPSISLLAGIAVPQGYSRYEGPSRPEYDWSGAYGVGSMQRLAARRARQCHPEKMIMGLGAWNQEFPDREPEEAMDAAYAAAIDCAVDGVRWWSAKHIWGKLANSYAAKWLESRR